MSKIKSYWFEKDKNFGDLVTPFILDKYGIAVENCPIDQSDILVVGSILQDLQKPFLGHVVGSGLIADLPVDLSKSKVWALRGELTKLRANVNGEILLADPGLLLPLFLKDRSEKEFILGIVPHYVDKQDPGIQLIANRYNDDVLLIDVQRDPLAVAKDIDRCCFIISSSLHGLIIADGLGISNDWVLLSQKVLGGGFKFHDYFSAFAEERQAKILTGTERLSDLVKTHPPNMEKVRFKQEKLDECFKTIGTLMKSCGSESVKS